MEYDFICVAKLKDILESQGFRVCHDIIVPDREFSFEGPAHPDVLQGWNDTLDRMVIFRAFVGVLR